MVQQQTCTLIKKPDTAEIILDAAERLCGTHGIEAVSIRDIAAEAEVSIAVIYHHYKSKTNLLRSILRRRYGEFWEEHERMLTELDALECPPVGGIVRAVMQPINQWRQPGRQAAMQFYALALVCPLPEIKDWIDSGVVRLQRVTALLQRALPGLTREDICWRLHFVMKITHQTQLDMARLRILSKGECNSDDAEEALDRAIAFAEAAFMAPPLLPRKKRASSVTSRRREAAK
ncbi:MAG: TetR family transcriptional regulator [Sinobacteraceae bacterium]|nr:TetR family transcriptional regulator [Nevskiaceae bacterium]